MNKETPHDEGVARRRDRAIAADFPIFREGVSTGSEGGTCAVPNVEAPLSVIWRWSVFGSPSLQHKRREHQEATTSRMEDPRGERET